MSFGLKNTEAGIKLNGEQMNNLRFVDDFFLFAVGVVGWVVVVGTFGAESRWFYSNSSRHLRTFGKSFTRNFLYDAMRRPVAALRLKFDSCNSMISYAHTLLVNIILCVRLYIKRKY